MILVFLMLSFRAAFSLSSFTFIKRLPSSLSLSAIGVVLFAYLRFVLLLPNFEPVNCSLSGSNCCFLTCTQVSQEMGKVVWYSLLFKNFPQFVVIRTVKGFGMVSDAEVDVFETVHSDSLSPLFSLAFRFSSFLSHL